MAVASINVAVAAQEVHGLAQRSAQVVKEIKDLISTSLSQVAQGVDFVSASGRSFEQIVAQVGGVTTMISRMAEGARQQSVALREILIAAGQMVRILALVWKTAGFPVGERSPVLPIFPIAPGRECVTGSRATVESLGFR